MDLRCSAFLVVVFVLSAPPALAQSNRQPDVEVVRADIPPQSEAKAERRETVQQPAPRAEKAEPAAKPAKVAKPEPAAKAEPVAAKPEPVAAKPEPVAAKPEPAAARAEPVAAKAEPAAVRADAVAAKLEAAADTRAETAVPQAPLMALEQTQSALDPDAPAQKPSAAPPAKSTPMTPEEAAYERGRRDAQAKLVAMIRALAVDSEVARRRAEGIVRALTQYPDLASIQRDAELVIEVLRKQQAGAAAQVQQLGR